MVNEETESDSVSPIRDSRFRIHDSSAGLTSPALRLRSARLREEVVGQVCLGVAQDLDDGVAVGGVQALVDLVGVLAGQHVPQARVDGRFRRRGQASKASE